MRTAITLRQPPKGLIFHSHRGAQYTSQSFQNLLKRFHITASMSGIRARWDHAVVERFFGSVKYEWLVNVFHLIRQAMKEDVDHYIRYYNHYRLHTANDDLAPIEIDMSQMKVSGFACPVHSANP